MTATTEKQQTATDAANLASYYAEQATAKHNLTAGDACDYVTHALADGSRTQAKARTLAKTALKPFFNATQRRFF